MLKTVRLRTSICTPERVLLQTVRGRYTKGETMKRLMREQKQCFGALLETKKEKSLRLRREKLTSSSPETESIVESATTSDGDSEFLWMMQVSNDRLRRVCVSGVSENSEKDEERRIGKISVDGTEARRKEELGGPVKPLWLPRSVKRIIRCAGDQKIPQECAPRFAVVRKRIAPVPVRLKAVENVSESRKLSQPIPQGCKVPETVYQGSTDPDTVSQGCKVPETSLQERELPVMVSEGHKVSQTALQYCKIPETVSQGRKIPETVSQGLKIPENVSQGHKIPETAYQGSTDPETVSEGCKVPETSLQESKLPVMVSEGHKVSQTALQYCKIPETVFQGRKIPETVSQGLKIPENVSQGHKIPETAYQGSMDPETVSEGCKVPETSLQESKLPVMVSESHKVSQTVLQYCKTPETVSQGRKIPETVSQGLKIPETISQGRKIPETVFQGRKVSQTVSQGSKISEMASQDHKVTETVPLGRKITQRVPDSLRVAQTARHSFKATKTAPRGRKVAEKTPQGCKIKEKGPQGRKVQCQMSKVPSCGRTHPGKDTKQSVSSRETVEVPIFPKGEFVQDTTWPNSKILSISTMDNLEHQNLPSVTRILNATMSDKSKKLLALWAARMIATLGEEAFNEYRKDLLESGKLFHRSIYCMLRKFPVEVPNTIKPCMKSIASVLQEVKEIRAIESHVVHDELRYRGVIDCVATFRGKLCLIDWKKSERVKYELGTMYDAPMQLASYIGALNTDKNYPFKIKSGLLVIAYTMGYESTVYELDETQLQFYWRAWLKRLERYYAMQDT